MESGTGKEKSSVGCGADAEKGCSIDMNIMIDFVLCILAAAALAISARKNTIITVTRCLALAISVTAATFIAGWTMEPLSEAIPNPIYGSAVNDMADLVSAPYYATADETADSLSMEEIRKSEDFDALLEAYGTSRKEIDAQIEGEQTVRQTAAWMAKPVWQIIVKNVVLIVGTALLYLILIAVLKAVLYRFFPKDVKRKIAPLTFLFAALSAVIIVSYLAIPVMESFRPFSMGVMKSVHWDSACERSVIYGVFRMLYIF